MCISCEHIFDRRDNSSIQHWVRQLLLISFRLYQSCWKYFEVCSQNTMRLLAPTTPGHDNHLAREGGRTEGISGQNDEPNTLMLAGRGSFSIDCSASSNRERALSQRSVSLSKLWRERMRERERKGERESADRKWEREGERETPTEGSMKEVVICPNLFPKKQIWCWLAVAI